MKLHPEVGTPISRPTLMTFLVAESNDVKRKINRVIVHCSYTPPDSNVDVKEIQRWHVEDNGWSDIGYHFVIDRKGVIFMGRPMFRSGAHVQGHNDDSIGVCLLGGMSGNGTPRRAEFNYTHRQMESLRDLVASLAALYQLPEGRIIGHRDLDSRKECPCFDVGRYFFDVYGA